MNTSSSDVTSLCLRTSALQPTTLSPLGDIPDTFVVSAEYDVVGFVGYECREEVLGHVQVERVLLGAALNTGMSWFEIMDARQDLADIFEIMFEPHSTFMRDEFVEAMGDDLGGFDLCYVPDDEVLDQVWGPAVLHLLAQHTSEGHVVVGVSGLVCTTSAELTTALIRAAKLEAMGFQRYLASPYFFLNSSAVLNELPDHLALAQVPVRA